MTLRTIPVDQPLFHLFSGGEKNALWVGAVTDAAMAQERIEEMARETPGRYFVFSSENEAVVAVVDSSSIARRTS